MRTVTVGVIERLHPPELLQGRQEVAPVVNGCAQRVVGLDEEVGVADTSGELHELFAEVVSGLNVSLHEVKGSQPEKDRKKVTGRVQNTAQLSRAGEYRLHLRRGEPLDRDQRRAERHLKGKLLRITRGRWRKLA